MRRVSSSIVYHIILPGPPYSTLLACLLLLLLARRAAGAARGAVTTTSRTIIIVRILRRGYLFITADCVRARSQPRNIYLLAYRVNKTDDDTTYADAEAEMRRGCGGGTSTEERRRKNGVVGTNRTNY